MRGRRGCGEGQLPREGAEVWQKRPGRRRAATERGESVAEGGVERAGCHGNGQKCGRRGCGEGRLPRKGVKVWQKRPGRRQTATERGESVAEEGEEEAGEEEAGERGRARGGGG